MNRKTLIILLSILFVLSSIILLYIIPRTGENPISPIMSSGSENTKLCIWINDTKYCGGCDIPPCESVIENEINTYTSYCGAVVSNDDIITECDNF